MAVRPEQTSFLYILLTYMATLDGMRGVLELFEVPDWESRMAIHPLYVAAELFDWVDGTPELQAPKLGRGGRTLFEHLLLTFCDFRCSIRPPAGDLRRMIPNKHGIWKMHPFGLRVYGWFAAECTFVAVTAALESETKADKTLNNQKLHYVKAFIEDHGLQQTVEMGDILAIFPNKA
jgi:hypothetical protein